jgi:hypothetical protein
LTFAPSTGELNDVRNLVLPDRAAQPREVGHVALDEADLPHFLFGQNQPQPPRIFLEVVNPRLNAALQEIANNPGADAAVTACKQDAHINSVHESHE